MPYDGVDGVVGAWYGKGPGLDRCGDVLKHANFMGTGPNGGAVLFVGDDPSAKSSTLPYDTNAPLADAAVPVLVPADQQDLLDLAVEAFRLSRACGSWVGVRIVTAVADGIGAVDTDPARFPPGRPRGGGRRPAVAPRADRHDPAARPRGALARPPPAGRAGVGRGPGPRPRPSAPTGDARLGIVCAGRTYRDVLGALEACGVGPDDLAAAGIRILKLALTHPVVPSTVLGAGRPLRRGPGRRGEAAVRRAAGAGGPPRGRARPRRCGASATPTAGRSCPTTGELDRRADRRRAPPGAARPAAAGGRSRRIGRSLAPPARPAGPHAGVLQRLPAQPLDGRARWARSPAAASAATG